MPPPPLFFCYLILFLVSLYFSSTQFIYMVSHSTPSLHSSPIPILKGSVSPLPPPPLSSKSTMASPPPPPPPPPCHPRATWLARPSPLAALDSRITEEQKYWVTPESVNDNSHFHLEKGGGGGGERWV